jgi:hypothetical protein
MSQQVKPRWRSMRDKDTRLVESVLRKAFPNADVYRYNSASIRVRIIDARFAGKSSEKRDALVEPHLRELPEDIQSQIINLLTLSPGDVENSLANMEFEDPSNSLL